MYLDDRPGVNYIAMYLNYSLIAQNVISTQLFLYILNYKNVNYLLEVECSLKM